MNNEAQGTMLPMVMAVVVGFAFLFIGGFVMSSVNDALDESIEDEEENSENQTESTLSNISGAWGGAIDIMQVVIIVTMLAAAISAIFLFTRGSGRSYDSYDSDSDSDEDDEEEIDPFDEEDPAWEPIKEEKISDLEQLFGSEPVKLDSKPKKEKKDIHKKTPRKGNMYKWGDEET